MTGPFADISLKSSNRTFRREWELEGNFDDGHGFNGLSDVGKRGRDKERERMRRREKERRVSDDDDWFGSRIKSASETNRRQRDQRSDTKGGARRPIDIRDSSKTKLESPGDRLLARISSSVDPRANEETRRKDDRDKPRHRESRREPRDRERKNGRNPNRSSSSTEQKRGQKYYGGYGK